MRHRSPPRVRVSEELWGEQPSPGGRIAVGNRGAHPEKKSKIKFMKRGGLLQKTLNYKKAPKQSVAERKKVLKKGLRGEARVSFR